MTPGARRVQREQRCSYTGELAGSEKDGIPALGSGAPPDNLGLLVGTENIRRCSNWTGRDTQHAEIHNHTHTKPIIHSQSHTPKHIHTHIFTLVHGLYTHSHVRVHTHSLPLSSRVDCSPMISMKICFQCSQVWKPRRRAEPSGKARSWCCKKRSQRR